MNTSRSIVVNGYPLRFSGALQILLQFIRSIELYSKLNDKYYIFIDSSLRLHSNATNIEFIPVKQNFVLKAIFYFNFWGLNKILLKRNIKADKIISLANVNTILSNGVESYLYFHQALTIYPNKWSIFNREERNLFLYQKYYKWIIQKSITKNTIVVTQLDCISNRVSKEFNIGKNRILKVTPNVVIPNITTDNTIELDSNTINCIYPATPLKYKNHKVLFDALNCIPNNCANKIKLYLTCNPIDISECMPKRDNIDIIFLGHISFDTLMTLYNKMDALLFPSYIESFGLPMIEAATTGVKIIAADTDFANEVLKDYSGVKYVPAFDSNSWAKEILAIQTMERFTPLQIENNSSWKILFDKINQ